MAAVINLDAYFFGVSLWRYRDRCFRDDKKNDFQDQFLIPTAYHSDFYLIFWLYKMAMLLLLHKPGNLESLKLWITKLSKAFLQLIRLGCNSCWRIHSKWQNQLSAIKMFRNHLKMKSIILSNHYHKKHN